MSELVGEGVTERVNELNLHIETVSLQYRLAASCNILLVKSLGNPAPDRSMIDSCGRLAWDRVTVCLVSQAHSRRCLWSL